MLSAKPRRPVLNTGHPLARGLIGAWPLFTGGAARDMAVNLLSQRGVGTVTATGTTWTAGRFGNCINVSGSVSSHRVVLGDIATGADGTGPVSMFAVARPTGIPRGEATVYAACGRGNLTNNCVMMLYYSSTSSVGSWVCYRRDASNQYGAIIGCASVPGGTTTGLNVWYTVVGTYSGVGTKTFNLYVNGYAAPSATGPLLGSVSANSTWLGNGVNEVYGFSGDIADVRIWKRELSAAEARDLCRDPWAMYRPARMPLGRFGSALPLAGGWRTAALARTRVVR